MLVTAHLKAVKLIFFAPYNDNDNDNENDNENDNNDNDNDTDNNHNNNHNNLFTRSSLTKGDIQWGPVKQ